MQREKVKGMTWIEQKKTVEKADMFGRECINTKETKMFSSWHDFLMSGNICHPFPLGISFFSLLIVSDLPNSYVHLSHPCSCTFMPGVQE